MSEEGETIRSIAVKLMENKLKVNNDENSSRVVFVVGSKYSGKTSLVNILLDKDEVKSSETLGLEYTFSRKNMQGHLNDKTICHIWELGGDMFKTLEILNVPFIAHGRCYTTIILFLDLSQPKSIWSILENLIHNLRLVVKKNEQEMFDSADKDTTAKDAENFPMPLFIVGGKYDLFSQFDSGVKKVVCKMLRSVNLLLGSNLLFFTRSDQSLKKRLKDVLNTIAFGSEKKIKSAVQDYNKPLFILSGQDSWESIGISKTSWDAVKSLYIAQFPQIPENVSTANDPSLEANYREPAIDLVRSQRDEELKIMIGNANRSYF